MALGAVEALKAAGKEDALVIGFDGNDEVIKAVNEGKMAATVVQQPIEMGKISLQAAYDHFAGKKIDDKIDSPLELIEAK